MPFDATPIETPIDTFTLDGLIAWLATQDPNTRYEFNDGNDCLITRFVLANGGRRARLHTRRTTLGGTFLYRVPTGKKNAFGLREMRDWLAPPEIQRVAIRGATYVGALREARERKHNAAA
jgi:hypothetical protein